MEIMDMSKKTGSAIKMKPSIILTKDEYQCIIDDYHCLIDLICIIRDSPPSLYNLPGITKMRDDLIDSATNNMKALEERCQGDNNDR